MSYKKKKMKNSRFGKLTYKLGLVKAVLLKFAKRVVTKVERKEKPMFQLEKAVEVLRRYDRLTDNPDNPLFEKAIMDQWQETGLLRLNVFVCPKFNTKALQTGTPENYMPVEAGPDLFEPRIQKIVSLRDDLMKAGLPTEINVIIGDNDAEEYIFPFIKSLLLNLIEYREKQNLYRASFERRCQNVFGENRCSVWSLAENNVTQDKAELVISNEAFAKELKFFEWLFSIDGPYRGTLSFSKEILSEMICIKYRLYGAQGKFLEILGGILLQTEGPGVWLERTQMLKCTGSVAIPTIYPWIRKNEEKN
jgi:hypothetical protein